MPINFTQQEVESELSDIVKRDHRTEIARLTQIYPAVIYGMINPDDERKSYMFGYLQIQCALDRIDPEVGEQFFQAMARFRELSKPCAPSEEINLDRETSKLNKEASDVISARLEHVPLWELLKQAEEHEAQAIRYKQTVICAIQKDREQQVQQTFNGRAS